MVNKPALLVLEESASYLDQDGLWKGVITDLFDPFLLFFAPKLHERIDWTKQPDSMEQELRRAFPRNKGKRYTDKLMKVHLRDGKEQWILVHVEVQGYKDDDFAERMFQSYYRIFDLYNRKIFAIALYTDDHRTFKPTSYYYCFHGTEVTYKYNTYKLLDQDENKLLQSDNPFSYAVLAGIYALRSKANASERFQFKRKLFELVLRDKRDNAKEYTDLLLYFIDFLLEVPKEMTKELKVGIQPKLTEKEETRMGRTFIPGRPDPPTIKLILDDFRKEGREQGLEEGRKVGREEGREEVREEGREEGQNEVKQGIAIAMRKKGFPTEDILELTGLSKEELDELNN